MNIPAQTTMASIQELPGTINPLAVPTASQGTGSRGGAGTGEGTGIGPGKGSGLGPGEGGGTGGGVYRPGNGVVGPTLIKEIKPGYTAEAMRAKIQGVVLMEAVVLPDGSVGNVQIVRSLDPTFGLDQEAVKTVKQWRFAPGTRFGVPVAVLVEIEMTFTLR
jgi:TonB family protein